MSQPNTIYVYKTKKIKETIKSFLNLYKSDFKSGQTVVIKPNWVNSRPDSTGATTNMHIIEAAIEYFQKNKMTVKIAEGSGYEFDTKKTFKVLQVEYLTKKYNVPIINTRDCKTIKVDLVGKLLKKTYMPKEVIDADWIINIPKIKTHVITGVTFCQKNLFGLLPDKERRYSHVFGLDQAIVDLGNYFNNKTINILDGLIAMSGEGPVFGDTFNLDLLICGQNIADIDKYTCDLLKINYKEIGHIRLAEKLFVPNIKIISNYKDTIPLFELPTASKFYKFRYWGVFAFDWTLSRFTGKSLIPWIVTRFGVRLNIMNDKCTNCKKCIEVCPENAISIDPNTGFPIIDFEKCRYVRCFKCFDVCKDNAINIKGFSRPRHKDEDVGVKTAQTSKPSESPLNLNNDTNKVKKYTKVTTTKGKSISKSNSQSLQIQVLKPAKKLPRLPHKKNTVIEKQEIKQTIRRKKPIPKKPEPTQESRKSIAKESTRSIDSSKSSVESSSSNKPLPPPDIEDSDETDNFFDELDEEDDDEDDEEK